MTKAFAYLRTSSATNVGADKDSDKRQMDAIERYARKNGYQVVGRYYDAGVKGSDPVHERPGFADLLLDAVRKKIKVVLIESPDRFARDLIVQLTGHELMKQRGMMLIPTTAPDFFEQDTPTATMVRQILGAVFQFEKATLVGKLKAARDRASRRLGERIEGRRTNPAALEAAAKILRRKPTIGHRELSRELAALGLLSPNGHEYSTSSISYIKARVAKQVGS